MSSRNIVVPALMLFALACDSAAPPTAIDVSLRKDAAATSGGGGGATCELAVRTESGQYVTRTISLEVPRKLIQRGATTTELGFVERTPSEDDPSRLALCTVPSTPAVIAWLTERVSGSLSPEMMEDAGGTVPPGVKVYTGDVTNLCDPGDEGCSCSPGTTGCEGWEDPPPEEEPELYPPPEEPDSSEFAFQDNDPVLPVEDYDGGGYTYVAPECWGATDYAHNSTHAPGMVNVVGRTFCNFSAPELSVDVTLQRWRCMWFLCWYSAVGYGYQHGIGVSAVQANAAAVCTPGKYRGRSWNGALFPSGWISFTTTVSRPTYLTC